MALTLELRLAISFFAHQFYCDLINFRSRSFKTITKAFDSAGPGFISVKFMPRKQERSDEQSAALIAENRLHRIVTESAAANIRRT